MAEQYMEQKLVRVTSNKTIKPLSKICLSQNQPEKHCASPYLRIIRVKTVQSYIL